MRTVHKLGYAEAYRRRPSTIEFLNPDIGLDPRVTFTRSTIANRFNSAGNLAQVAIDVARANTNQDYNPATLAALGFLIEEARTDVVLWNRDFTNAAWSKTDMTAAKTATGITGDANSASTLTATGANGTALQSITLASSARFQTVYIKRRTGTGVIEMTMDNGATWTAVTVTGAWTRVSIPTQTLANPTVGLRIVTSGDEVDVDFLRNENGVFETSPMATTTAAVARTADNASITGTNFSRFWNPAEGTLFAEFSVPAEAVSKAILTAGDGTANNRIILNTNSSRAGVSFRVVNGGVDQCDISRTLAFTAGQILKMAVTYKANDFAVCVNGGTVGTDTSGTVPTVTALYFGDNGAGTKANIHIRRAFYIPTRTPNAELQAMTV